MLQQTTVKTVGPYFARFLARWPDVGALAAAPLDDVLRLWAGLGYYARARNLHACARAVAERGGFPRTEADLVTLPGIGRYTAAAIASIAFDAPAVPVDGNVERVVTRLFAIEQELPAAKPEIHRLAHTLMPAAAHRRFRAGADGPRRHHLHAGEAGLRAVPLDRRIARRGCAAIRRRFRARRRSGKGKLAPRRGVRGGARRRLRAAAQPAAEGIARRHDRGAEHGMVARLRRQAGHAGCAAPVTRQAGVAAPARRGDACVHAFPAGARRLRGGGAAQRRRARRRALGAINVLPTRRCRPSCARCWRMRWKISSPPTH